jgi:hypothetical protein
LNDASPDALDTGVGIGLGEGVECGGTLEIDDGEGVERRATLEIADDPSFARSTRNRPVTTVMPSKSEAVIKATRGVIATEG